MAPFSSVQAIGIWLAFAQPFVFLVRSAGLICRVGSFGEQFGDLYQIVGNDGDGDGDGEGEGEREDGLDLWSTSQSVSCLS